MSAHTPARTQELGTLVSAFITERLSAKLEKLAEDDPKRAELQAQFVPAVWLEDAARRVSQIQAVTHSLKPIHPDAKGSSLFREPSSLASLAEVGSHTLGASFDADVVGNAAALDVYKFLKLVHQGRNLLELSIAGDADFAAALSDAPAKAQAWMAAFAGLADQRDQFSSHTQAKQIYWPIGGDPHDDAGYHLLAPLYPTSLIHRVHLTLRDDRFSDSAKAARAARKAGEPHERVVHDYGRDLAIQKLGGTKPQNISQLNSERRGENALLASLPPVWKSADVKPLYGVDSLFKRFGYLPEVRTLTGHLRRLLDGNPDANKQTRERRDALVEALIDELLQFAAELGTLDAGWSNDPQCDLPPAQRAWLDPEGSDSPIDDASDRVASDFANWLNARLRDPLPMGDAEYIYWRKLARTQFKQEEREAAHEQ